MKNLRFVCAQPAIFYYTWQIEVMLNNFIRLGITKYPIDILCGIENDIIPNEWIKLKENFKEINFYFYNDTRENKNYQPSIYFNLMKQHLLKNPSLKNEVLFLHDCDIIFTEKFNLNNLDFLIEDDVWYLSDTNSYINYNYIIQKGLDVYERMCNIIGIDKIIPKLMNSNSGGAQYIIKNTNYEFWDKVEKDSINLYKMFCETEHLFKPRWEGEFPIQKWTAGMWSFLWNGWLYGNETIVTSKLNFTWAPNPIDEIYENGILHNAGVVRNSDGLFFKGDYTNRLPYNDNLMIKENKVSYYYWKEVCKTAENSVLYE